MLQLVRDKAKGVISWIILSLIFIVFASWGVKGFSAKKSDRVVALVDGKKVYYSEISKILDAVMARYNNQDPEVLAAKKAEIRNNILEDLIYKNVTVKYLEKLNYRISSDVIINYLSNLQDLKVDGKFSLAKYKHLLKELNLTEDEYISTIASWMLIQQFSSGIEFSSFANEQDVKDSLSRHSQVRDFGFFKITNAQVAKIEITDQEIQSHYNKYQNQYVADDQYIIEHVMLDMSELLREIKVPAEKVEKYYYENINEFTLPERWKVAHILVKMDKSENDASGEIKAKAEDLLARIKLGEKFNEVAKKHSQDSSSANNGGSLGWFTRSDHLPEEIFYLAKKGDFTSLVQTDFGYHIFYLEDKQESKQLAFGDVKVMLETRLRQEQAEAQLADLAETMKNMMFQLKPFSAIAEQLKLKLNVTDRFATFSEQQGVLALPAVQKILQELKSLPLDTASELVQLSDESFVAVKIKEIKPGVKYSLDHVRAKIIAELKKLKDAVEVNKLAAYAVEQIGKGANPRQVAEKMGCKWQTVRGVSRNQQIAKDSKITPELLKVVFELPNPKLTTTRPVKGILNKDGTQTIVALSDVRTDDSKENADPNLMNQFSQKISSAKGVLDVMTAIFTARDQVVVEKYS
jgi:peptidyl-prolyl cis-trans isomerase D